MGFLCLLKIRIKKVVRSLISCNERLFLVRRTNNMRPLALLIDYEGRREELPEGVHNSFVVWTAANKVLSTEHVPPLHFHLVSGLVSGSGSPLLYS